MEGFRCCLWLPYTIKKVHVQNTKDEIYFEGNYFPNRFESCVKSARGMKHGRFLCLPLLSCILNISSMKSG